MQYIKTLQDIDKNDLLDIFNDSIKALSDIVDKND
jgi:hypothetical protein